jgi:alkylation response protein AidB-like acyl-CoA dehydrogenase
MSTLKGGEFLIKEIEAKNIFTMEDFSEEQKMLRDSAREFIDKVVVPNKERFEKKDYAFTEECMKQIGEMGFLGIAVPENYGGLGLGFVSTMIACDYISGATGSLATAYGAHTGIGTLPILLYGTEEQKQKYLPDLAAGTKFGAYCLTEPDAGSDANSGKTKAKFLKMVNIISSTDKKCGFLTQVLQIHSHSLLKLMMIKTSLVS